MWFRDKPLALNSAEGRQLRDAAVKSGAVHAVTFNYRGNPLIQQARAMVAGGDAGEVGFVHGHYLQDWMADPNVYSWRSDPSKGGSSSALGDIGSHWCDLAEHVSGPADRLGAGRSDDCDSGAVFGGSFGGGVFDENKAERTEVAVSAEDLAERAARFTKGAKGCFSVGQVLHGHKNDLLLEVNGGKLSLKWLQEQQNELWIGHHRKANEVLAKDPSLILPQAKHYAHLPGGHQESWADAFFNVIREAYHWIARKAGRRRSLPRWRASKMGIVRPVWWMRC